MENCAKFRVDLYPVRDHREIFLNVHARTLLR